MIQILLLILKIIGIVLLAVLGLIFLVLALVLFVPIFYQVRIIHNPQQTKVTAKVSFLWPAVRVVVQYLKKLSFAVKIFGIPILDSGKPKKDKKEKPKKDKKPKKKKEKKQKRKKNKKQSSDAPEVPKEEDSLDSFENSDSWAKDSSEEASFTESAQQNEGSSEEQAPDEEKQGVFAKIKAKIQKIRETISNIISKIKKLLHQKDEVLRIFGKPETKETIGFVFGKLGRILKHVLPRKIKGYVCYGSGDPASTGQTLGILGAIYARTGQILEIRPNFVEKQLECDVLIKGRIQVFTLLLIAIKVILNKGVRQVIKDFKGIKDIE